MLTKQNDAFYKAQEELKHKPIAKFDDEEGIIINQDGKEMFKEINRDLQNKDKRHWVSKRIIDKLCSPDLFESSR